MQGRYRSRYSLLEKVPPNLDSLKHRGHPLSIEIIAKSIRSLHQLGNISESLGTLGQDSTQSEKRFQTLRACFDYTKRSLDKDLQELL